MQERLISKLESLNSDLCDELQLMVAMNNHQEGTVDEMVIKMAHNILMASKSLCEYIRRLHPR